MTMYWIYDLANWQLCVLTIGTFVGISLAGLFATRPLVKKLVGASGEHNEVVTSFFAGVGVLYGLALGLIAVATFSNYTDVDGKVSKEAASLAGLYRGIDEYRSPLRERLEAPLKAYAKIVIEKEWPAHRRGEILDDGKKILVEFENDLMDFEPSSEREKIVHTEVVHDLNELIKDRDFRIQAVGSGLPAALWFVVLLGAAMNIAITYLYWIENPRLHALLVASLAASIGLLVFVTAAMDNPVRGEVSVSPDAFQTVLDKEMAPVQPASAKEVLPKLPK